MRLNNVLRKTQHILALCAVFFVASCATTRPRHQWVQLALRAENMQAAGDLDAAQSRYQQLLEDAPTVEDRRWLTYNLGQVAARRGETEQALKIFGRLYTEDVVDRFGANAMYDAAKLTDDDEMRRTVIRHYPSEVAAEFALADLVRKHREARPRDLEQQLKELHDAVAETEVDDNVLFDLATLRREQLADPDGALDAYRTLYRQDPDGPLADDALWEMAALYREHQMWLPAVEALEILASDTESSWFVGIYRSDWVDDAVYQLGWIHLVWLDDFDTARQWFKRYLKRYPDAIWADDAAWQLVETRRLRGEREAYRDALEEFPAAWPQSRHVRIAERRLGSEP